MSKIRDLKAAVGNAQAYKDAARRGTPIVIMLMANPVMAQGFVNAFNNLTNLTQIGIGLLVLIGALGGFGFILGGLFSMYKKYDRGNDDITWGKIGMQIGAGGLAMALSWVGVQVVETLGGSQGDIGRGL